MLLYTFLACSKKATYAEGDIRSVRFLDLFKGEPGGFFPNAVMIDLQYLGETQQIKYFCSKKFEGSLQLCGMQSIEQSRTLAEYTCQLLNTALHTARALLLSPIVEALSWLRDVSHGPVAERTVYFKLHKDRILPEMCFCTEVYEETIQWPASVPTPYLQPIQQFLSLSSDLLQTRSSGVGAGPGNVRHHHLVSRVATIANGAKNLPMEDFSIVKIEYSSIIMRYDLGADINRYELNNELLHLGYDSDYKLGGVSVMVHMAPEISFNPHQIHRKDRSGIDKFIFSQHGVVTHYGSLPHLMKYNYEKLFTDIYNIRNKIFITYTT